MSHSPGLPSLEPIWAVSHSPAPYAGTTSGSVTLKVRTLGGRGE